jgi:putative transcriptional regulator
VTEHPFHPEPSISTDMQSLEGQILIATPDLLAPMFSQSVVLMIDHDENGAIGVILNRPTEATMTDLSGKIFDDDFEWDKPLHIGGPVKGTLAVLHTIEEMADREVIPGVFLTLEATKVQHILSRKPQPSFVVANYSGWGPGQLESEIERDSWKTLPARAEHVFWTGENDIWEASMGAVNTKTLFDILGIRKMPADPGMN